jgi:hypothetical protein
MARARQIFIASKPVKSLEMVVAPLTMVRHQISVRPPGTGDSFKDADWIANEKAQKIAI